MKRDPIDFHEVPEAQMDMHARLENWGRACTSGAASQDVAPGFSGFRSNFARGDVAPPVSIAPNRSDAARINHAVVQLIRQQRVALQWFYVRRTSIGHGKRLVMCLTAEELQRHVLYGRAALIAAGV